MVTRIAENRLQTQCLIFGTFGRNSGTHRFKDYFYAFSAHVTIQGIKLCELKGGNTGMCRNFRLLHFFFLEMELLLTELLSHGFLRGTLSLATSGCRCVLIRIIFSSFRLRACDNGNPIEIGFLKINFVRANLAVKTHVKTHRNMIIKNENLNTLRKKDSATLVFNTPNFRIEVVW
jgi:hypothetical protein